MIFKFNRLGLCKLGKQFYRQQVQLYRLELGLELCTQGLEPRTPELCTQELEPRTPELCTQELEPELYKLELEPRKPELCRLELGLCKLERNK